MPATRLISDYWKKRKSAYAYAKAPGSLRRRGPLAGLSMGKQRRRKAIYRKKTAFGKPLPGLGRMGQPTRKRYHRYRRYGAKGRRYNRRQSAFRRRIKKFRFGIRGVRHVALRRIEQVNVTLNTGEGTKDKTGKTVYEYPIFRDMPLKTVDPNSGNVREWLPQFAECATAYKSTIFDCYKQWRFNGISVTYSNFKLTRVDAVGIKEDTTADDLPEFQLTELEGVKCRYLWDTENHYIPPTDQPGAVLFEASGIRGDENKVYKKKYIKANSFKPTFRYYYKAKYQNGHTMGGFNRFLDADGKPEFTEMFKSYNAKFQQFTRDIGITDEIGVIKAGAVQTSLSYRNNPSLLIGIELDMDRLFTKNTGDWGIILSKMQLKYDITYKSYWTLKDPLNYQLDGKS